MGQEFDIKVYFGKELELLTDLQLLEIANCYKEVFNESWGESWTTESALKEVRENFTWRKHRIPVAAFLCVDSRIVGFAWALLQESEYLMERDMPFDLPIKEKRIGLNVSRYWLDAIVRKKIFLWREVGVLRPYRRDITAFLGLTLFNRAYESGHDTIMLWTNLSSQEFKWGLGMGLFPLHFFLINDLLLMGGSVKQAIRIFSSVIGTKNVAKSNRKVMENINHYLFGGHHGQA